jgi:hypothetical protein
VALPLLAELITNHFFFFFDLLLPLVDDEVTVDGLALESMIVLESTFGLPGRHGNDVDTVSVDVGNVAIPAPVDVAVAAASVAVPPMEGDAEGFILDATIMAGPDGVVVGDDAVVVAAGSRDDEDGLACSRRHDRL